jgi:DNA-binding transcriptional regulator LsrR (DeoR family)
LQSRLIKKYRPKLKSCIVADITLPTSELVDLTVRTEAVALLAAKYTLNSLPNTGIVGMTGGTTIARFVDLVPPGQVKLSGIDWVSLLASKFTSSVVSSSANNIVARMVYNQPGSVGYQLPYISPRKRTYEYLKSASGDEAMLIREASMVVEKAKDATQAYISVGSPEFNYQNSPFHLGMDELQVIIDDDNEEKKVECVGDVLLTLIDENGNRYGSIKKQAENDELVYTIGLPTLQRIADKGSVWILANRFGKAKTIHGCLHAGYANCLVIDSITANHLLNL